MTQMIRGIWYGKYRPTQRIGRESNLILITVSWALGLIFYCINPISHGCAVIPMLNVRVERAASSCPCLPVSDKLEWIVTSTKWVLLISNR
jgi:hypothetical protein